MTPLLSAHDLHKSYRKGEHVIPVLKGVDFDLDNGEFVSLVGVSGSGKSTLLHLLGTLDRPDTGCVFLQGIRIDNASARRCEELRNVTFGFIFQFYHLLPELTVLENALMPHLIQKSLWGWWRSRRELKRRAVELIDRVGLSHRANHKPRELSGGEMQRAAIARAVIHRPQVLLADEPTGNLDPNTGLGIVRLLRDLNREEGLTVLMVTHNPEIAADADRTLRMTEGRIESEAVCAYTA